MFDADMAATIRRQRRKLTAWRVIAIAAVALALLWPSMAGKTGVGVTAPAGRAHVARVRVGGLITGDARLLALLKRVERNPRVRALIVHVDSPGGTTTGSEAVYKALRRIARTRPVAVVQKTIATSGGYIVSLAADRIFASGNTLTGSIGVIVQWPELRDLLGRIGVKMRVVKSGRLKAQPNGFEPFDEDGRRMLQEVVRDSYDWFLRLVAERRRMSPEQVRAAAGEGRVYTGRQALKRGLIDQLGDEEDALIWLRAKKGVSATLGVVTYTPKKSLLERLAAPGALARAIAAALGLRVADKTLSAQALDGLLAVWHPALARPGN
ncbi:MAG TPA: signal peptide peptidase SppA [Thermopetrobacter sp.]|nr:signal peptide peptidase SppA [Thermopetrobacter sp.]